MEKIAKVFGIIFSVMSLLIMVSGCSISKNNDEQTLQGQIIIDAKFDNNGSGTIGFVGAKQIRIYSTIDSKHSFIENYGYYLDSTTGDLTYGYKPYLSTLSCCQLIQYENWFSVKIYKLEDGIYTYFTHAFSNSVAGYEVYNY